MMRTQKIDFPDRQTFCVFPNERSSLAQATSELGLKGRYPVIVLIGGEIDEQQADATRHAIQSISKVAEDMITVIPANSEHRIAEGVQAALSINEKSAERIVVQIIEQIRS